MCLAPNEEEIRHGGTDGNYAICRPIEIKKNKII